MDWTLIKTHANDEWEILYAQVPPKLRRLHTDGFRIVVFTNQGGVASGKRSITQLKTLLSELQVRLGIPMTFLAATGFAGDLHRKPNPYMWDVFCERLNGGIAIDNDVSFYCGDAAGRGASDTRMADWNANDIRFARNIGLNFATPESLFLGELLEVPALS